MGHASNPSNEQVWGKSLPAKPEVDKCAKKAHDVSRAPAPESLRADEIAGQSPQ